MANKVVRYNIGAGIGELSGTGATVFDSSSVSTSSTSAYGVASDFSQNLYISDSEQCVIYKVTKYNQIFILAGSPGTQGYVDAQGSEARFKFPKGMTVDHSGNVYVCDSGNNRLRIFLMYQLLDLVSPSTDDNAYGVYDKDSI